MRRCPFMNRIGENLHVIAQEISVALKNRDAKVMQDLARKQTDAKVDYIDINLGPARRDPDAMGWMVEVIQEVTDLPLSLDTMNPAAMESGLKIAKNKVLINSASNRTDSKQEMLPLAVKYNCDVVLSVITDQGCPADYDGRVESILEGSAYANELGIENERLWVDPIAMPISSAGEGQKHSVAVLEFIETLQDLVPEAKSTIGLSNVSNSTPDATRDILNRTYAVMLDKKGIYSAIVDAFDEEMVALLTGKTPDVVDLIYKVMDGEEINIASLDKNNQDYVKTARVLMGQVLYSDGWLED
jgi:5-methyltetrahydrofolate corrinoid/iron sulfur protein methyltransferase